MSTESKKVEVKMLIPYGIIIVAIVASVAYASGWHNSQGYNDRVKADAANMLTTLSPKDQKQK